MSLQCPRCHSPKVASFHHAMKVGAAIGTVGGVARGVIAALAGGQAGALIGAIAGPVGISLGSVSGQSSEALPAVLAAAHSAPNWVSRLIATSWPTTSACSAATASICLLNPLPHSHL